MLVLPAGHAAVRDVGELSDETWIAGCPRCRGHLLELCGRAGFTPHIGYETDNYVAAGGSGAVTMPGSSGNDSRAMRGSVATPMPCATRPSTAT
jgi:hypothetical protein